MSTLHVRFANFHKIKLLGFRGNFITIEELVQKDHFGFKSGLESIMETIASQVASRFQVEFVFNIDFAKKPYRDGVFHVVQLTLLPEMSCEAIEPLPEGTHTYLSTETVQGHGIKRGIKHAVVVSPFSYTKEQHDEVRRKLREINRRMGTAQAPYLAILPGRIGSTNRDWGINVDYSDVDQAAALFEYGVDVAGRAELLPDRDSKTGGIYGSHFLYMIQGGHSEEQKRLETRMYGTQGTHFLTNIMSNNVFYGFLAPQSDHLDPWFFSSPTPNEPIYVLTFPSAVTIYADSVNQRCAVLSEVEP